MHRLFTSSLALTANRVKQSICSPTAGDRFRRLSGFRKDNRFNNESHMKAASFAGNSSSHQRSASNPSKNVPIMSHTSNVGLEQRTGFSMTGNARQSRSRERSRTPMDISVEYKEYLSRDEVDRLVAEGRVVLGSFHLLPNKRNIGFVRLGNN